MRVFVRLSKDTRDPYEREFELSVVIPLLKRWQTPYRPQVSCLYGTQKQLRGRIDFLLNTPDNKRPLTLFENKRRLLTPSDWRGAALQARSYAQAKGLRSFVVASPEGMRIYQMVSKRSEEAAFFTFADVTRGAPEALQLLLELSRYR